MEGGEGQSSRCEDVLVIGKLHIRETARLERTPLDRSVLELGSGERWREAPGLPGSPCQGAESEDLIDNAGNSLVRF